ncbi:glycosyltransferase family 4 protein [Phocaeicola sp.]
MKICVLGTRGFPRIQGGVEKHCESLYPLLDKEFHLIIFRRKSYVNSSQKYPNIHFVDLYSTKIKGFETVFHSLVSTLASILYRPDIVHIHNIGPALFSPILRLFGLKVVLTYHSPNYEHEKWGVIAKGLLRMSEKIALWAANGIIFVNRFQMEKYSANVQSKSHYIPNGIPDIIPSDSTDYIDSLGLISHKYIIGVGRITPEKGFDVLIRAFENLETDFKLVIVGGVETESNYLGKLYEIIKTNRVIFTGYIYGEELNQIYSNAALYVLSSYNEGFPLVLLEAMKYGLSVLVSDIPATHLVFLDKEDYFESGNVCDLSSKLHLKIKKYQRKFYDLSQYRWIKIAQKTITVYRGLR